MAARAHKKVLDNHFPKYNTFECVQHSMSLPQMWSGLPRYFPSACSWLASSAHASGQNLLTHFGSCTNNSLSLRLHMCHSNVTPV